jgi:DNA-binding protein YbaB
VFDNLKAIGALTALMKNQDKIKDSIARVKGEMEQWRVTGQAGGGAARVVCNGHMKVIDVELTPALVAGMAADDRTRQLAGNLIAEATNDAIAQAQRKVKDAFDRESAALGLGDLGLGSGLGGLLS